jgi:hypothetical protein
MPIKNKGLKEIFPVDCKVRSCYCRCFQELVAYGFLDPELMFLYEANANSP